MKIVKRKSSTERRGRRSATSLNINSLLDILVILLVFLLKNFSTTAANIVIPRNVTVPDSKSQTTTKNAVVVLMDKELKVFLDKDLIVDFKNDRNVFDSKGARIIPLYDKLVEKREAVEELAKQVREAKSFSGMVNMVMDKSLPYQYIRKIMFTATAAGYQEFKFITVQQEP
jgi:biopolymer transport protein ExbD